MRGTFVCRRASGSVDKMHRIWLRSSGCDYVVSARGLSSDNKDPKQIDPPQKRDFRDFVHHWSKEIMCPPNIVTSARIVSTPYVAHLVLSEEYGFALCGFLLCGLSDLLDGHLARTYNMKTVLGSYLDPLADKIVVNVVSVSLWKVGILPGPLALLWCGRDIALVVATYLHVRSKTENGNWVIDPVTTPLEVKPSTIGRINTALQFGTIAVGLVQPVAGFEMEIFGPLWYDTNPAYIPGNPNISLCLKVG